MPAILTNYKQKDEDTFILIDDGCVYPDLPIAIKEKHKDYKDILVVPIRGNMTVVEKEDYLATNKKFKLKVTEDGKIVEASDGQIVYLPKDTDISKAEIVNGQLVFRQEEAKDETVVEDNMEE